jgi:hypothetical protein
MEICGQHFSKPLIDKIQATVCKEPSISRRELSRRVCHWLSWQTDDGRLQDMSCRKALANLNHRGVLELPSVDTTYSFQRKKSASIAPDVVDIQCSLSQLGKITVEPISSRYAKQSKIWFTLMDRYHYLGSGPLCGAQIRYLVKSSIYGVVGGLAFSSATWALKARDRHIGWTESARRTNLSRVVCNTRFLIVPTVKVKNLASHVLSMVLGRLERDWQQRYHVRPVLVETFVNPIHFGGTCYKAANWNYIGDTAGRRDGVAKKIFVYYLCSRWQETLCVSPPIRLGDMPTIEHPAHWAEEEFGTARLYDTRLKQRLYTVARDFYNRPQANMSEACGSRARTIGAYRFFQNEKITMDVVLTAHTEATIARIKEHQLVLAPQDTTTLNYSTHPATEGLGPIRNANDQFVGLILHDTMAFTEDGTPLGILDAQCWARDPEDKAKSSRRKQLPIEQKESMKWLRSFRKLTEIQKLCPDTMLVSIGDRESDIYELFLEACQAADGPRLLVRYNKSRQRKVEQQPLQDFMANTKVCGTLKIHVPRSGSRKARDTYVDIRFAEVELDPPSTCRFYPCVRVWAIYVQEQSGLEKVPTPIEWMLLTTAEVTNFSDAKKRVEWYSGRWGIEVYHRTLKSGCRIKDRQLSTADRIEACLGVDMVVAWRIYHLTMLGRETPEVPCTVFFKDIEWKALCCYTQKTSLAPEKPPTLGEAMLMVGALGGHLGRRGDGPPGTQVLWRGIQRLDTATEMYSILVNQDSPHPQQSGP